MNHELRYCASLSPHRIDIEFVYQGLHEFPAKLQKSLGEALERVDPDDYDYVLLNYGLCGNGTLGITHSKLPIIIHNVHDCIPLLVGDREAHNDYIKQRPGTFWFSFGWIEGFPLPGGHDYSQKYAEFYNSVINARQRDVIECMLMDNYTHLTFIRWDELGNNIAEEGRKYTKDSVASLNERLGFSLQYDEVKGSPAVLQRFVEGEWNGDDFIFLEPGKKLLFDAVKSKLFAGE
jgi:transposase